MAGGEGSRDFVRVLVAYFLPPAGVLLQVGFGMAFLLNCLLTLFFWIPGVLHAVWVICTVGSDGQAQTEGKSDFVRLVLAAVFPPAGAFLQVGFGMAFWLNCLLTCFFWIPGVLHAVWVITHNTRAA
jgi:uncharacterized membrane protein YqaE (UPF0057 family)